MNQTSALGHPVIGILGGMGPEATVDLMRRIVAATPAQDDSGHVHMLVDNNPRVPSRIAALIEGTGPSPAPELVRMARNLEAAGATILAMPCNTAHAYAGEIRKAVEIPLLDMIALAAARIGRMVLNHRRVGMLASTAVMKLGLYETALAPYGVSARYPERQGQLMNLIIGVKRGDSGAGAGRAFAEIARDLIATDVDLLVIACTELSVLASGLDADLHLVDAMDVLVDEIVAHGLGRPRGVDSPRLAG